MSDTDLDILTIEVSFDKEKVRVLNAYCPQEPQNDSDRENVFKFWSEIEEQIENAKNENCKLVFQCDANAKLGSSIFEKDPHEQSENGLLLHELVTRQNLSILNMSTKRIGHITLHRNNVNGIEQSILDYIIVCEDMKLNFESMHIDDNRIHVLTKYSTKKGFKTNNENNSAHLMQ